MHKAMLLAVFVLALLVARAVAQEIIIEPTNGRPQTASHSPRPAAIDSAPAQPAKSASPERSTRSQPVKHASAKQIASASKPAPVETKPAPATPPSMANSESATPAPKKVPLRPAWAVADTRDARSLQIEIANALARDPKLASSSIHVNVDDTSVTLEGRAAGSEERLEAERLAQSYAWNRKLTDRVEVVLSVSAHK